MTISILGAGAFGSALAVSLSSKTNVTLWARDDTMIAKAQVDRSVPRLAGVKLPETIVLTSDLDVALTADTILVAIPAQKIRDFVIQNASKLGGKTIVSCSKGIDLDTLNGPGLGITKVLPEATVACLTGPSFAADIARGLPTALTLACPSEDQGKKLQQILTTPNIRLYRTNDLLGAELGGALKNVMAIACGACIGKGFGDSARAALMTRGFAEMQRLAAHLGARAETLAGLSGLGDLALTCTSDLSRNYRFGLALGKGESFDSDTTVEGAATALAVAKLAKRDGLDLPISQAVASLVAGEMNVNDVLRSLLARPLKEE